MKKLLLACAFISTSVFAQHGHHHGHHWHGGGNSWYWVGPSLIGGIIGYEMGKNQQPTPQPVIIQPVPVPQQMICGPWTEIRNANGTVTYTRTCQ